MKTVTEKSLHGYAQVMLFELQKSQIGFFIVVRR
jgi:hypothetical protein